MTIFLPWRSEFGMMLLKHVRYVNSHPATDKLVCTERGLESLFPSALSFIYDWQCIPDNEKSGRQPRSRSNRAYLSKLCSELKRRYPDAEIVSPAPRLRNEREWNFCPEPATRRGLFADVVIGPRFRQYAVERNYAHWQSLIDSFISLGLSVGALGAEQTSVPNLRNLSYRSWDYDVLDAGIELLKNCRLAVMTCSGPAHLAVLCGVPLKVIYEKPGRTISGARWPLNEMKRLSTAHCEPILYGWNNPAAVVSAVREYLQINLHTPTRSNAL